MIWQFEMLYDADGRKTSTTNAVNEVTRQSWNKRGEAIQTTDGATNIFKRVYDAIGNQITLTDRNGKKWHSERTRNDLRLDYSQTTEIFCFIHFNIARGCLSSYCYQNFFRPTEVAGITF